MRIAPDGLIEDEFYRVHFSNGDTVETLRAKFKEIVTIQPAGTRVLGLVFRYKEHGEIVTRLIPWPDIVHLQRA